MSILSIWLLLFLIFESVAFILSVIYYKSLKENKLKTFPYFLFFILAGEITGIVLARKYHTNIAFYNIFTTAQFTYYLLLLYNSIDLSRGKKIITFCIIFFALSTVINFIFIEDINTELISYSFTIGCVLITLGSAYFFYELLHSSDVENYATYPLFWIILGIFVFYVCNIPYMSVYNYLSINYKTIFNAYFKIIYISIYIMYSFFIIGIICSSKRK